MKIKILVAFLGLWITQVYAQNASKIPLYKKNLVAAIHDSDKVAALALLCFHYSVENVDTAIMFGKQALSISKKMNYKKGLGDSYNSLGWAFYRAADYDRAEAYLVQAIAIFKNLGDLQNLKIPIANLATVYMDKTEYGKSLTLFRKALSYNEKLHDKEGKAIVLFNIGRLYNLQGNTVEARKYFQQSSELHRLQGNEVLMAEAILSMGNTYQKENNHQEALRYYNECLPYLLRHKDNYRLGFVFENRAGTYLKMGNARQALQDYTLAKNNYLKINSTADIIYALMGIGEANQSLKQLTVSASAYEEALRYTTQLNDKNIQQQIAANLAQVYKELGAYDKAYLYLEQSTHIKDSLFTKAKQDELLKLQTQFESENKEKENQLLIARNLVTTTELQRNKYFLIVAVTGVLLSFLIIYALYRNRQIKIINIKKLSELNERLEAKKEEITKINTILELKALRSQLNPHFIFNCMSSIQECMLTGRLDDANTYLTKLSRLLRMVLIHADDESISLAKELEMLRLYLQLESVRLNKSFEYNLTLDDNVIPEEVDVPTFFIQPFAENAIWHGLLHKTGNRLLDIHCKQNDNALICTIEDNGIGRAKAALLKPSHTEHSSRALSIMQKRFDILSRKNEDEKAYYTFFDLESSSYEALGTRVVIVLPLVFL